MSREILDVALMQQFKEYLSKKGLILETLDKTEVVEEHENFLNESYPGSKGSPIKLVELMVSPDPDKSIQSQALVNPEGDILCSYPMDIPKLSCQLKCPDNSHLFDLLQSTSENVSGWTLNIKKGPWNDILSNNDVIECGKGILII